jgi:hypothetical protein
MIAPDKEKLLDDLAADLENKTRACHESLLAFEKELLACGDKEAKNAAKMLYFFKQVIGSVVASFNSKHGRKSK